MKLSNEGMKDIEKWIAAGFELPQYDRDVVVAQTKKRPSWIHFGAGNIFRAYQANAMQRYLNTRRYNKGIIVAEGFDYEIIDRIYKPHDNLSVLATLKCDGSVDKTIVGSVTEALKVDPAFAEDWARLKEVFGNPSLQVVSFTITEKGYSLLNAQGQTAEAVSADFANGPENPVSYMGKVAALLYHRFKKGELPIAMVSMDNCSHNGDKLYAAMEAFAKKWVENGKVPEEYLDYICNHRKVSFPWTMIDKITPRPDASVEAILRAYGMEDTRPIQTAKNTYIAPFVNAEETEYLVIEDNFPNGRPHLEDCGFMFTERETVDKVEKMKVCTCLNPLHTALAVYGCILGYEKIFAEMRDPELLKMVQIIGYEEGLPVVVDPKILNPRDFLETCLEVRFPNPFMPDTPQRIATDTSQKLSIRYGETIKAYAKSSDLDPASLRMIPMVLAGWFRYLMAVDDIGNDFRLSPDPLLPAVTPVVEPLKQMLLNGAGPKPTPADVEAAIGTTLHNQNIFGVDLYEVGLASAVCEDLASMCAGKGAVRTTLKKALDA